MFSKFLAALALSAACAAVQAAPAFDVSIKWAEAVGIALNEAGEGTFESAETVLGYPATVIKIVAVNVEQDEFDVIVESREGVIDGQAAQGIGIIPPELNQWSYRNRIKLPPGRTFQVKDELMQTGVPALSITRTD
jgi:hypothetical protein